MPNLSHPLLSTHGLSFRAKRGICFFLFLGSIVTPPVQAQTKRPKILGIGRVSIEGRITPTSDPISFYAKLRLDPLYSFQAGATAVIAYALNDHQEIHLVAGPRPDPDPKAPPPNNVSLVLFETSDVLALHDYLQSRQIRVSEVAPDSEWVKDSEGKPITGDASLFTSQDPDGHWIGFLQYKQPLKFY